MNTGADCGKERRKLKGTVEEKTLLALHVLVVLLVVWFHDWLPEPKGVDAPLNEFSAGRSIQHLSNIVGTGVRTVGSKANDIAVPQYLLRELRKISRDAATELELDIEIQWPSGGFTTPFLGNFVNTYSKVTNIIARLRPKGSYNETHPSLLVSAHYDSALGTVGASDDCVNIATMIELVRLLAANKSPQEGVKLFSETHNRNNAIIFNFNGAEETNWQAAHGFITQHRWAKDIKAMINLEASGTGGREIVIQNGPANAWISREYAKAVPYPHIHGVAQMIFQSGVLPAQTDFQTYRDNHPVLDQLPGMDLAVIAGGYVYHTPQDDFNHIDPRHVQRLGENVFSMIPAFVNSPYLANPGDMKYEADTTFDVFGLFIVSYSSFTGNVLNILITVAATYSLYVTDGSDAMIYFKQLTLPAVGLGIAGPVCVGVVLTLLGANMTWYSNSWIAHVIFPLPAIGSLCGVYINYARIHHMKVSDVGLKHRIVSGASVLFIILLLPMALLRHTLCSFMMFLWLIPVIVRGLCITALRVPERFFTAPVYILLSMPALVVWWHVYLTVLGFFLPLTGRIGNQVPPNVIVGLLSGILVSFLGLIPMCEAIVWSARTLRFITRISAGLMMFTLGCSMMWLPVYTTERPKRLFMQHVHRFWHDASGAQIKEDSALWINPMDYAGLNSLVSAWPTLKNAKPMPCNPENNNDLLYCDKPWYFPVQEMLSGGVWLPIDPPQVDKIKLDVKRTETDLSTRLSVKATGPAQMTLVIGQREGNPKVLGWSFADKVLSPRKDCKCHWVFHAQGVPNSVLSESDYNSYPLIDDGRTGLRYNYEPFPDPFTWEFYIDIPKGSPPGSLNIAIYGHYLDKSLSGELSKGRLSLPTWVSDLAWSSTWSAHKI